MVADVIPERSATRMVVIRITKAMHLYIGVENRPQLSHMNTYIDNGDRIWAIVHGKCTLCPVRVKGTSSPDAGLPWPTKRIQICLTAFVE